MILNWNKDLETGYELIDKQHKELFNLINDVFDARSKGKGKDEIFKVINFLERYIIRHFKAEEDAMLSKKYPQYEDHKLLHDKFKEDFSKFKSEIKEKEVGIYAIITTNRLLSDWWINHIMTIDMKLAAYLKSK